MNSYTTYGYQDPQRLKHKQPSKHARKLVHQAFDADALKRICVLGGNRGGDGGFEQYADKVTLAPHRDGTERFYYYKDNGSNILAVAHLDSVWGDGTCSIMDTAGGLLVASGALDDRLGAYVILELLPALGVKCDWLLTTDEEMCASTGSDFVTDKEYNWMIQFDRGGTDVVMYDYETDDLCELVENSGARVGRGSYSDICVLDHLGIAGFNWGVGYEDYHGPKSHAWLDNTFRMVARFVKFYNANRDTFLEHSEPEWRSWQRDIDTAENIYDVKAECGHIIKFDDPMSYVELDDRTIICAECSLDGYQAGPAEIVPVDSTVDIHDTPF